MNICDKAGRSPLHLCSSEGHLPVVSFLVEEAGAEIDKSKNDGRTPLFVAATEGRLEVVQYLVGAGADMHFATSEGQTPLSVAQSNRHLEVMHYLMEQVSSRHIKHHYTTSQRQYKHTSLNETFL